MKEPLKYFISQRMNGFSDSAILAKRAKIIEAIKRYDKNAVILDSFQTKYPGSNPNDENVLLMYLSKSLETLAKADVIVLEAEYMSSRGCYIESVCAKMYDIKRILYTEDGFYEPCS